MSSALDDVRVFAAVFDCGGVYTVESIGRTAKQHEFRTIYHL